MPMRSPAADRMFGLDSAMAQEVIVNLRALQVKQGCTFVARIAEHQTSQHSTRHHTY